MDAPISAYRLERHPEGGWFRYVFNAVWFECGPQGPASAPMPAAPHPHGLDAIRSRRNRKDVWKRRTRLSPLPVSGSSVDRGMRLRPVRNRTVTWHLPPMPYRATEPGNGSPNNCPVSSQRSKWLEITNCGLKQRDWTIPFCSEKPGNRPRNHGIRISCDRLSNSGVPND